jgi:hypothetical protein
MRALGPRNIVFSKALWWLGYVIARGGGEIGGEWHKRDNFTNTMVQGISGIHGRCGQGDLVS